MPFDLLNYYLKLPVFMLVLARLGGMIALQPILAAMDIPARVRALLILGLAAMVTPFVELPTTMPDTVGGLVIAMAGEIILGALMGLAISICFVGMQLGGTLIAQESGLAIGQIADPNTGVELALLGSLYVQLASVVYLIVGGHRALLAACLDTFQTIPLLGEPGLARIGADLIVDALTLSGVVAIRVAAPAVLTLFLVNLAMGFIARTVPQLNIITIGFSLKALIGFVIMAIALPSAIAAFTDALDLSFDWLTQLTGS